MNLVFTEGITVETEDGKRHQVIQDPYPHILIRSNKELHGWWPGKRECTAERMLVNPYNGCSIDCLFCYTKGFSFNYFRLFLKKKVVTVWEDFDQVVADQLNSINVASCGYLSPVTDPFQPLNNRYRLAEKIIKVFVERNIPIEFVTKAVISDEAIELIRGQIHSFAQVSILTPNEDLRKILVPGGATTAQLFENLRRLSKAGIYSVLRIDPVLPYITDKKEDLKELILQAHNAGVRHIIASCLDIPRSIWNLVIKEIKRFGTSLAYDYSRLYQELIDNYYNANIDYRKRLFSFLREESDRRGMSFALCMEYELQDNLPVGLNRKFMSSINCEGMNIPVYIRDGQRFRPATDCSGACLNCADPRCGIEDLAMARPKSKKDWRLVDYRRWSKTMMNG